MNHKLPSVRKAPPSDLEFLSNPTQWPQWPVCPVKRHTDSGGMPQIAFYTADGDLIHSNVFAFRGLTEVERSAVKIERLSPIRLIENGWIVD